ncbi:MAG: hypothetical protein K1060chlam3_00794 [Candidatus Anoxychlamydiales bacterium]|nr:hypothetical protein [Candidatus Anoxychlamydiales bacterium]
MSSSTSVQLMSLQIASSKNINQKPLPQDVVQMVGKVRLQVVVVFSEISAFFNVLKNCLFGNSKSFKENYKNLALDTAYAKKLTLYSDKKLNSDEKAFLKLIGQDIFSFEDLKGLNGKIKKDQNVFKLLKGIASKASKKDIEKLLKKVKAESPKNYKLVLEAANRLAVGQEASDEIKNLLDPKLQKVEDNLDMRSEYKKPSTKKAMIPRRKEVTPKAEGLTTKKKILVGGAAVAITAGIAAGVYYTMPGSVAVSVVQAAANNLSLGDAVETSSLTTGGAGQNVLNALVGGVLSLLNVSSNRLTLT